MIPNEFFKLLIFVLRQMYQKKKHMTLPFSSNSNIVVVVVVVAVAEDHNMERLYNLLAEPQDHCMQHDNHCMQLEKTTFSQTRHAIMPASFLHHHAHLTLILALGAIHEAWIPMESLAVLATLVASNTLRLEPPNRQHLSTRRIKQVCDSHERLMLAQVWQGILTPARCVWRL